MRSMEISTSDLDAAMLRFCSWSASSSNNCLASLDVTAAFLHAALPEGRVVVLRPSTMHTILEASIDPS